MVDAFASYRSRTGRRSRLRTSLAALAALLVLTPSAFAALQFYDSEAAFLIGLAATPYTQLIEEDFEDDGAWGSVRSTIPGGFFPAPAVLSQGLTWTANSDAGGITTGSGAALTGDWGLYAYPHGSYLDPDGAANCTVPGDCGDGFRVAADVATILYGVGGWIRTNTPFAKVGIFASAYDKFGDGCSVEGVDCDDLTVGTTPQFFGLVDSAGFTMVEFRELEGTSEDAKLIFGDDFTIAAAPVPLPPAAFLAAQAVLFLLGWRRHV